MLFEFWDHRDCGLTVLTFFLWWLNWQESALAHSLWYWPSVKSSITCVLPSSSNDVMVCHINSFSAFNICTCLIISVFASASFATWLWSALSSNSFCLPSSFYDFQMLSCSELAGLLSSSVAPGFHGCCFLWGYDTQSSSWPSLSSCTVELVIL